MHSKRETHDLTSVIISKIQDENEMDVISSVVNQTLFMRLNSLDFKIRGY